MTDDELVWRIAGGSGDGIDSTSQNFAKALMRSGLDVFTHRHYPSRIRGGHTYVEVRAASDRVAARGDGFNFLLALGDSFARNERDGAIYGDERAKPLYENLDELRQGGIIVYDEGLLSADDAEDFEQRAEANNWHIYPVDLRAMARDRGREVMRNTAGVGVTCALLDYEREYIEALMRDRMSGDILAANLDILDASYEATEEFEFTHDLRMPEGDHDEDQVLVSGSNAITFGAIDSGCRFISGYPMTPWTEVFTLMTQYLPQLGGISEQVEDEIAAAALALGASHAGVKAMSGSSGGGFALMSEPLGLAEMNETPIVLLEAMRAGPSTGMPTKPEQADLEHVLYTSQGDSNRLVFAPGNAMEAYTQTRDAFHFAYEYGMPAIVVYDQKLSGELLNVDASFFDQEPDASLGAVLTETELEEAAHHHSGKFERYTHDSESGAASRSIPGQKGGRYLSSGNEHHPTGHISEDPHNRVTQMDRRMQKLTSVREELDGRSQAESNQEYIGPDDATYGILTWGSNQGTVTEAVGKLNTAGASVKALSVSDLMPFPAAEVTAFLESVDSALVVEMNASAQFKRLLQGELGRFGPMLHSFLKYNGEPFEPREIVEGFESMTDGDEVSGDSTRLVRAAGD
jgi:pyruvate ferredoxin oxidoreductase alpha subunit